MRSVLVLVFVTAFYANVKCGESAVVGLEEVLQSEQRALETIEASVKSINKHELHETQDQDTKKILHRIELIRLILQSHQHQLDDSKQQTKILQGQLQSENESLAFLQLQVSNLIEANVQSLDKPDRHETQDKDYRKLLQEIKQLKSNLTTQDQLLKDSQQQTTKLQSQLQSENATLVLLQQQVSYLSSSNVNITDEYQLLNQTLISYKQELDDVKHQIVTLQSQLNSENATLAQFQQQVSYLNSAYANVADENQLLNKTLTSHKQQLDDVMQQIVTLQTQLQNENKTVILLQQNVSDLSTANANVTKENLQLKTNLTTLQNQLNALQPAPQWVPWATLEAIPQYAVFAGDNWNNIPLYVARTNYSSTAIVVKACPTIASALFSYYGKELTLTNAEVLTGSGFSWEWGSNGNVPAKAFPVGKHITGALNYIGRVHHPSDFGSSLTPGTVVTGPGGALFISFSGKEYSYANYQVLVHN